MKIVRKKSEEAASEFYLAQSANEIESLLVAVRTVLQRLNSFCFVCASPLATPYAKMQTCGNQICDFNFKESNVGIFYDEIKANPDMARFMV